MANEMSMRAAVLEQHNAPFKHAQIARPTIAPGHVLVRVRASGVNPLDLKIRAGMAAHAKHPLPAILGIDMAGVVEALGEGVASFNVGDEVYGMTGGVGNVQGSLAQYAVVDARLLSVKPKSLSLRQAASMPLVYITAWEGLMDRANVREGQSVLVQGGAGGVGNAAVQLARAVGARVFATGSPGSADIIRHYGAIPIDYTSATVDEYVARHTDEVGFDLVYDTVGGSSLDASFSAVRRFGHVVSSLGWGSHALAPLSFRAATYSGVFTLLPLLSGQGREHHGEILREIAKLVDAGKIHPRVDEHRFGLDSVHDAHALQESGKAAGKIVVDID
ncbi:zinc-dependent alcohol dehydrogenase family protein [Rhodanobacter hydrolyticus]|uniref:Zinc-dependent alcohol dehydrogenase family protein n=2 Tax=Rhodanobacter hydrolyticus TaxID=2250595 RepID=A0ABW8J2J9_9GAMM